MHSQMLLRVTATIVCAHVTSQAITESLTIVSLFMKLLALQLSHALHPAIYLCRAKSAGTRSNLRFNNVEISTFGIEEPLLLASPKRSNNNPGRFILIASPHFNQASPRSQNFLALGRFYAFEAQFLRLLPLIWSFLPAP